MRLLTFSHVVAAAIGVAAVGGCSHNQLPPGVEFLTPDGPPRYPFSPAVRVGNMIYLAGQIGTDSSGTLVAGGIQAEARQALNNIGKVLEASGSSLNRVVKCTVFMADMSEWPAMNEIYATYFKQHFPARSAFGTTGLALNARVEIDCIAVTD
ncbi:MAG TPA: RidA family protein [Gemmatimonadaceae bacterium]|jgi:reactive intermediate/imine deaminase|nr:RidA family protein [Gemmatimonadaceae bacterium]